ncbi:hypothetical protein [Methylomonas albis]|uniref:Uncharacterized protein n=1 Tax=Methylomonas albis TaxID=1854563 RepID=A0ABR9CZS5_9GAMM|nr:hypothetical protein [Methylomonas albis]MBD9356051.1 hypothetical protein [Methylomonas albis]
MRLDKSLSAFATLHDCLQPHRAGQRCRQIHRLHAYHPQAFSLQLFGDLLRDLIVQAALGFGEWLFLIFKALLA